MGKKRKGSSKRARAADDEQPQLDSAGEKQIHDVSAVAVEQSEPTELPPAGSEGKPIGPPPKKRKKKKHKRKTQKDLEGNAEEERQDQGRCAEQTKPTETTPNEVEESTFPFQFEPDDHCESPRVAYEHVACLLKKLGRDEQKLRIYDPYYCDGAVQANLEQLGFPQVHNQKEDCYLVWESGKLPAFDVFVTNPPYSAGHIEKLMQFITSAAFGNRPWFLLLPNWVHKKDYFLKATQHIHPFYVVPKKRYVYLPPAGFRESKRSDTHKKSSPFVSMWYIWGGTTAKNQTLIQAFYKSSTAKSGTCDLARSKSALRDLRRKR